MNSLLLSAAMLAGINDCYASRIIKVNAVGIALAATNERWKEINSRSKLLFTSMLDNINVVRQTAILDPEKNKAMLDQLDVEEAAIRVRLSKIK